MFFHPSCQIRIYLDNKYFNFFIFFFSFLNLLPLNNCAYSRGFHPTATLVMGSYCFNIGNSIVFLNWKNFKICLFCDLFKLCTKILLLSHTYWRNLSETYRRNIGELYRRPIVKISENYLGDLSEKYRKTIKDLLETY